MLSKSLFRLGLSCPNKIYFKNTPGYVNQSLDDPFLKALASGGFQIEEYARRHFPNGQFIEADYREKEKAILLTSQALQTDGVYFEAAFSADNLFALTDIVVKEGNTIKLIEVKSKSYSESDKFLSNRDRTCASGWKDYLFDLAFQTEVAKRAYPNNRVESFFFLVNKQQKASVTGLSQMIRLPNNPNADPRKDVKVLFKNFDETGTSLMREVSMTSIVSKILAGEVFYDNKEKQSFESLLERISSVYAKSEYPNYPTIHAVCKQCEFRTKSLLDEAIGKSGFAHCYRNQHGLVDTDFSKRFAFDLHAGRLKPDAPIFLNELTPEILGQEYALNGKITQSDRRLLQIEKEVNNDSTPFILKEELKQALSEHKYPLHFIDFEAGLGPLPPIKGVKPYQNIPFQFSHHILHKDGTISHHNQVVIADVGAFPNFDFVRALKKSLGEEGTIFRYHSYENTVLRMIAEQLADSSAPDKEELIQFIDSITQGKGDDSSVGERNMIDLQKIIYWYYYDPATNGGNSIKDYLPAFLRSSQYLQKKYSRPIKEIGLNSLNDTSGSTTWVETINGEIQDPYKRLPPLFDTWDENAEVFEELDLKEIKNGGAALVAYAFLQYVELPEKEREAIIDGLYRYCELDTLAMVMIYEGLRDVAKT